MTLLSTRAERPLAERNRLDSLMKNQGETSRPGLAPLFSPIKRGPAHSPVGNKWPILSRFVARYLVRSASSAR